MEVLELDSNNLHVEPVSGYADRSMSLSKSESDPANIARILEI
jgi:hypothetical protein